MSVSIHPGAINTDLSRHISTLLQRLGRIVTYSVSYGAINSLYAGTAPAAGELNGKVSTRPSNIEPMIHDAPLTCFIHSISLPGHGSHFQIVKRLIPSLGKRFGIGAKSRSKTSSPFLAYLSNDVCHFAHFLLSGTFVFMFDSWYV